MEVNAYRRGMGNFQKTYTSWSTRTKIVNKIKAVRIQ